MARFREQRKEFPPFGVLYLAAVTEAAGHQVEIHRVAPGHTALNLTGFDAVGFSLASSATYGLMLQARRETKLDPGTLVMAERCARQLLPNRGPARTGRRRRRGRRIRRHHPPTPRPRPRPGLHRRAGRAVRARRPHHAEPRALSSCATSTTCRCPPDTCCRARTSC
ncbi:hypothetical protein ACFSTC_60285 [Nonomuraea ferruginea]